MDELASPFLRLPVELQIKVLNNISLYSDLKALRMTSKELSNIATPRLYRKVDLRMSDDYGAIKSINQKKKDCEILPRIDSLLLAPANLPFVRDS